MLIDDGPVIRGLPRIKRTELSKLPKHPYTQLNFKKHSLNPLDGIEHTDEGMLKGRLFLEVINAAFPAGANTLTKQDANDILLHALVESKSRTLSKLIPEPNPKERGAVDAYRTIQTVLFYPVLKRVLDRETNVSLDGIVIVRLDRALMGDRVCFILGNFLIAAYPGHVVVPDFPFTRSPPTAASSGRAGSPPEWTSSQTSTTSRASAISSSQASRPGFSITRRWAPTPTTPAARAMTTP